MSKRARSSSPERAANETEPPAGGFPWSELLPELRVVIRNILPTHESFLLALTCKYESRRFLHPPNAKHYAAIFASLMRSGTVAQAQSFFRLRTATWTNGAFETDLALFYRAIRPYDEADAILYAVFNAVDYGNVAMLQWVHTKTPYLAFRDEIAFMQRYAMATSSRVEIFNWIANNGPYGVGLQGHSKLRVVRSNSRPEEIDGLFACAALFGNVAALAWMHDQGWPLTDHASVSAIAYAARTGDLSVSEWLDARGCPLYSGAFHVVRALTDEMFYTALYKACLGTVCLGAYKHTDVPANRLKAACWLVQRLLPDAHARVPIPEMLADSEVAQRYLPCDDLENYILS